MNVYKMILKVKYILIFFLFIGTSNSSFAQEITVPIDVQLEILPKILLLNKAFDFENQDEVIKVGILYSSMLRASTNVKDEIFAQNPDQEFLLGNKKVFILPINISEIDDIKTFITTSKINVLYFTPLRGYNISTLTKICKDEKIITVSGVSDYVEEYDISVGFKLENNKLQIIINLESAKTEGANFSSRLLNVSKIK